MAFIEGLFCTQTVHLRPGGRYYHSWPFYSGVAVKSGSTVHVISNQAHAFKLDEVPCVHNRVTDLFFGDAVLE